MVIIVKRAVIIFSAVLLVLFYILMNTNIGKETGNFNHKNTRIIVIDAGHGDPDGGAIGKQKTIESEINLIIANNLKRELEERGYSIIMTRSDEKGLYTEKSKSIRAKKKEDMNNRVEIINNSNADIAVSIHMNHFTQQKYRGSEVLYAENYTESILLAELIQKELVEIDPINQTRDVKKAGNTLFIMKNAEIPTVIVECGFLSNLEEEKLLNDEAYQNRIAASICEGIIEYYKNVENSMRSN